MKLVKKSIVGLAAVLALGIGGSQAGTDLNEVAAFLVFPGVVATDRNGTVETWITITNGSSSPTDVHVSYINGSDYNDTECYECDFDIPMTGFDTETMVFVRLFDQTNIVSLDGTIIMACPWKYGFVTANTQDPITGEATTNNYLLGEEVVIDYTNGSALSVSAVSFQGKNGGNGDTSFAFDDDEYGKLPKVVAADFIAPTLDALRQSLGLPLIDASLTLFTLGFDRQYPPLRARLLDVVQVRLLDAHPAAGHPPRVRLPQPGQSPFRHPRLAAAELQGRLGRQRDVGCDRWRAWRHYAGCRSRRHLPLLPRSGPVPEACAGRERRSGPSPLPERDDG
jgi:hypothetical protein